MTTASATSNWALTRRIFALLVVGTVALIAGYGTGEPGVRVLIRATARASGILFMLAFAARPLRQFLRNGATRWLLANRRYLGVSGALAHVLHGIAIAWLLIAFPEGNAPDATALIFGGLGFVAYFAMGLTSSDAAVARLGRARWERLHTLAGYYVWFIFTFTLLGNVNLGLSGELGPLYGALYVANFALFLAVLGLRIAARARARSRANAPA